MINYQNEPKVSWIKNIFYTSITCKFFLHMLLEYMVRKSTDNISIFFIIFLVVIFQFPIIWIFPYLNYVCFSIYISLMLSFD